jgi:hypothetical protein
VRPIQDENWKSMFEPDKPSSARRSSPLIPLP